MNTLVQLPSGMLLNPAHIILARSNPDSVNSTQISVVGGNKWMEEDMSIEDFQNLLRGPEQTPIVSPIVNLDDLKPGKPCSFTHEGTVKHGIISGFGYSNGAPYIKMIHDGDYYTKLLNTGEVI